MEISINPVNNATVVAITGKLDALTGEDAETTLSQLLDSGQTKLVVDFTELSYISSAGLRILLKTAKQIKAINGSFVLCGMKDFIKEVFDVSGFSSIITITDTVDSAFALSQ